MTEPWNEQRTRGKDCTCTYLNVQGLKWRPLAWILGHETVLVRFTDGSEETFASQGEAGHIIDVETLRLALKIGTYDSIVISGLGMRMEHLLNGCQKFNELASNAREFRR